MRRVRTRRVVERRRRRDRGGSKANPLSAEATARPRSTRSRPAGGATTGRCCTRRTRCGTCPTSRSAPRSRPSVNVRWLLETLLAFFLAMGIGGARARRAARPAAPARGSRDGVLVGLAVVGLAGRGRARRARDVEVSPWLWAFIAVGGFLVVAYNLELFGGAFHSDLWFALAWGAFPVAHRVVRADGDGRASAAVAGRRGVRGDLARRSACSRRRSGGSGARSRRCRGASSTLDDGSTEPLDARALRAAPEARPAAALARDAAAGGGDCSSRLSLTLGRQLRAAPTIREHLVGVALELRRSDARDRGEVGPVAAAPSAIAASVASWNTT